MHFRGLDVTLTVFRSDSIIKFFHMLKLDLIILVQGLNLCQNQVN